MQSAPCSKLALVDTGIISVKLSPQYGDDAHRPSMVTKLYFVYI